MTSTLLACLTPPGVGAIATLALHGPAAWDWVRELAVRELPAEPQPGQFWLTPFGTTEACDQVVVAVKQITPEVWLELHCHGGREVVRMLSDLLSERGAEALTWEQFAQLLSPNPLQAAALQVLANAHTARTAAIALDQYQGAFARALEPIHAALAGGDPITATKLLDELASFAPIGLHLATPWRVVIGGAPNVGKSSLINALAGHQRSIVSPIPGTTRDVVTTLLAFDGWPVEISDTAGWRTTCELLEREGMARARQAMLNADLCIWLLDTSVPPVPPEANLGPVRLVINKIDLPPAWSLDTVDARRVSAETGTGLADLCQAIATWLAPEIPPPGAGVPFTKRLAATIEQIRILVCEGRTLEALGKLENLCRECD